MVSLFKERIKQVTYNKVYGKISTAGVKKGEMQSGK